MFYVLLTLSAVIITIAARKLLKPSKILLYAFSGFTALIALDYILSYTDIHLPVNIFTIASSVIGGIPAIITEMTLLWIFR